MSRNHLTVVEGLSDLRKFHVRIVRVPMIVESNSRTVRTSMNRRKLLADAFELLRAKERSPASRECISCSKG
ncbi:hypothetical protein EVAR_63683_1 [Eumeta japonica]|uniref:Uncharacterized protein n=1 Tax=Eumeta variegata TaxID=151549 RepID=A0A4C1Z7J2_EUMVA|nr:hypothetical protein EVAR_63683_1 [Eumeta japonica]